MREALHDLSLLELSEALRRREMSPVEVTRAQLERIEALDPQLHAYATITAERALERAALAEREIAAGSHRGPLHGVPIGIKDLCEMRGVRTAAGTRVLDGFVPDSDACVVERLEHAGAVVLGKLAMTEGAFAAHHPDVIPPVNPWGAEYWTGISSSGSGVATAAGLCFASLGSDTGGSIRFPSACNALVGIKPTYGRVSRRGITTLADSLDHIGPMAREVGDAAAVLAVIAGHDPGDPTSLRAPVPDYLGELGRDLDGVRLGVDAAFARDQQDPAIAAMVLETAKVFVEAGAELHEVNAPSIEEAARAWTQIGLPEIALAHASLFDGREDDYGPQLRSAIEAGRKIGATDYAAACQARQRFRAALAAFFEEVDLLLCPALGVPLPAGADLTDPAGAGGRGAAAMRFTLPFDLSGSPTLTLPCGFLGSRPVGLQLVARDLEEPLLVRAGHAYEQHTPWHTRHPRLPA